MRTRGRGQRQPPCKRCRLRTRSCSSFSEQGRYYQASFAETSDCDAAAWPAYMLSGSKQPVQLVGGAALPLHLPPQRKTSRVAVDVFLRANTCSQLGVGGEGGGWSTLGRNLNKGRRGRRGRTRARQGEGAQEAVQRTSAAQRTLSCASVSGGGRCSAACNL